MGEQATEGPSRGDVKAAVTPGLPWAGPRTPPGASLGGEAAVPRGRARPSSLPSPCARSPRVPGPDCGSPGRPQVRRSGRPWWVTQGCRSSGGLPATTGARVPPLTGAESTTGRGAPGSACVLGCALQRAQSGTLEREWGADGRRQQPAAGRGVSAGESQARAELPLTAAPWRPWRWGPSAQKLGSGPAVSVGAPWAARSGARCSRR